ncbi:hypothetical protein SeMB42_g01409 [Synchytrium endobioticum]|uniref:PXA domain-containing protein n=1 Tax=Synchytrium endobioticum TaxID=286115 RepID=A0A507DL98_9FUNG|nr:hypothetical protein SeLEV6574_g00550 [Synchytrium endobioticum]TPX52422.1 hypothetical protein SeMB42_g01409 [Synchytrium endobioticum]
MAESRPSSLPTTDHTESVPPEGLQQVLDLATATILSSLPDPLRSQVSVYREYVHATISSLPPPYAKKLPFLVILLLFSPRLFVCLVFIGVGFCWGFAHGVPTVSAAEAVARWRHSTSDAHSHIESVQHMDHGGHGAHPLWSVVPNTRLRNVRDMQILAKPASPAIEVALKRLLDLLIRDYILKWYTPLNVSKCSDFPDLIHAAVRSTLVTFGRFVKRHRPAEAFLTISDVFLKHMREYRAFEATSMTLIEYLAANPSSPFNRYSTMEKVRARLRIISHYLVEHTVPPPDRASPILVAFTTEITATSLLESAVYALADPDRLNQYIVSSLKEMASTQAKQDAQNVEKGVGLIPTSNQKRSKRTDGETDEIYVKVVEAKRLPILGQNGVYCAVLCGNVSHKTRKVASEPNPIWLQGFNIDWNKSSASGVNGIVVDIYNINNLKKDDLIGSVCIPHARLIPNKYTKKWFAVENDTIGRIPSHTAELLLEVMYISTNAIDEFLSSDERHPSPTRSIRGSRAEPRDSGSSNEADSTKTSIAELGEAPPAALVSKMPFAHVDFDPRSLTLTDILTKNQALLEFITFMQKRPGGAALVQFYVMADNYRQLSCLDASIESMKSDGEALLAVFFGPKAQHSLSLSGYPNLASDLEAEVKTRPSPHVFVSVQRLVLDEIQNHHFLAFKESDTFRTYLKEVESTITNVIKDKSSDDHATEFFSSSSSSGGGGGPNSTFNATGDFGSLDGPSRSTTRANVGGANSGTGHASTLGTTQQYSHNVNVLELAGLASNPSELDTQLWSRRASSDTVSPPPHTKISSMLLLDDDFEGDGSASLIEHLESDQTAEGKDFLIAAVAGLRGQLMVIDSIILKTPAYEIGKLSELTTTRVSLQSQISQLVDMIDVDSALESRTSGISNRVNLQNIRIKVYDASEDRESSKLGSSLTGRGGKILFTIQIERRDGNAGWMITRTYSDFVTFEAVLLKTFPKIAKMPLPRKSRINGRESSRQLTRDLETWSNVIVSDAAMCESAPLQSFLRPESVIKEPQRNIAAEIRGNVLKTIKTTGSVLKKVALEASHALDSILNDMEDDARGVPRRNNSRSSKESSRLSIEPRDFQAAGSPPKATDDCCLQRGNVTQRLAAVGNKHRNRSIDSNDSQLPQPLPSRHPDKPKSTMNNSSSNRSDIHGPTRRKNSSSSSLDNMPTSPPRRNDARLSEASEEDLAAINPNPVDAGRRISGETRTSQEGLRQRKFGDVISVHSSAASSSLSLLPINSQPITLPTPQKPRKRSAPPVITDDELELVLDCFFAALEEALALSDPSQWIRQKGLHVIKSLLRRAYSATLTSYIQKNLAMYISEESTVYYVDEIRKLFWPGGIWWDRANGMTPVTRTEEEIQDTKAAAKHLLVNSGALPTGGIQQIVGRVNAVAGITRVFNMLQIKELNTVLVVELLDALVHDIVVGTVE